MVLVEFCHNIVAAIAHVVERTGSLKEMENYKGYVEVRDKKVYNNYIIADNMSGKRTGYKQ